MKHFKRILLLLVVCFSVLLTSAQSPTVSLITCGPGNDAYTLFGHTAIRINQPAIGQDLCVNYGLFSFDQPNFMLRFILGQPEYIVGAIPTEIFLEEYRQEGRWVRQQDLKLDSLQIQALVDAIAVNCLPANREYRYNIFTANCTTKAADIIEQNTPLRFSTTDVQTDKTIRQHLHHYTANHPWYQFGIDLLLGVKADEKPQNPVFLPELLYAQAAVQTYQEQQLIDGSGVSSTNASIFTPRVLFGVLALLLIVLSVRDYRCGQFCVGIDVCLWIILGCVGLCLLFMVFSAHPTVSLNLQILLFNPLIAVFGWKVYWQMKRQKPSLLLLIYGICLVLFLIGRIWQVYAEGLMLIAVALLVRYGLFFFLSNRKTANTPKS